MAPLDDDQLATPFAKDQYPPEKIAEALAYMDNTTPAGYIAAVQWFYLWHNTHWYCFGQRGGLEYGIKNQLWDDFQDLKYDDDHEKHIRVSLDQRQTDEQMVGNVFSLHRFVESPLQSGSAATGSEPSMTQSAGQNEATSSCVKVLSRFFQVGRLWTRPHEGALITPTRFTVVKATGPPECAGLWIIALPPTEERNRDFDAGPPTPDFDREMSEEEVAEMRSSRTAILEGFPEPISYARIKEDEQRKEFAIVDPVVSSFVISSIVWHVG
ncbi:hypothetical protein EV356DRAFT_528957 [Viridothelium virens]|uniref:Uncharacterized protein n=1 Tax=Viridothelium virens TaxID=1048519 RepID=A0A6A6HL16_VIRVR|nr:hypothetical protein EV356DRAFT_528957 [Viridothelium virens]